MAEETIGHEVETNDPKGEVRKERGLNWAFISLGLIILTIIIGIFAFSGLMPSPQKTNESSNTSGAPVQQR